MPEPDRSDRMYEPAGQLERTALAWNRSLLALAVNGALLVRMSTEAGTWTAVAGVTVLVVTLAAWLATSRAYHRVRGTPARALLARGPFAATAAAVVALIGVVDLAAIAAHR